MHLILKQYSTLRSISQLSTNNRRYAATGANGPTRGLNSVQYNLRQTISQTFIILLFHSQTSKSQIMHGSVDIVLPKLPQYTYHSPFERPGFS